MHLKTEISEGILALHLSGNLIGEKAQADILNALDHGLNQGARAVVFDLSEVPHMNSSGLGTLITVHTRLQRSGQRLVIAGLSEGVRQLLTITKLLPVFLVADTVSAARTLIS